MNDSERNFMSRAIQAAKKSRAEDERIHPKVGAVVVRNGRVLGVGHRGERGPGDHAEFTVLEKKLQNKVLAGVTVYTTLEPCTTRRHPKVDCAERLVERKVGRVVIGMLDPDPRISGKGVRKLRAAGIGVDLFPDDLKAEVEEMNRDFIRQVLRYEGTGGRQPVKDEERGNGITITTKGPYSPGVVGRDYIVRTPQEDLELERRRSEEIVIERLWRRMRSRSNLKHLADFSEDHDFTLALISYLNWTRQVIGFSTPAPDTLPSFGDSHMFGSEEHTTDSTIPRFWRHKLKELEIPVEGGEDIIWESVKEKVRKGELRSKDEEVKNLLKVGWVKSEEGKEDFELSTFLGEYPKHLKKEEVRDCLLCLMNRKRKPEEEEVLGDLIVYLYWSDYRDCFDQASRPWGATLHDLVKFAKVPLDIVTPDSMQTVKRIINDEEVFLFSTGGGAWLLEYTVNYLCKEHKEKRLSYAPLIGEQKLLDEPDTHKEYNAFWGKLNEINNTGALLCFFEHPFQDRVLWEIARGENPRYPAEMLANRKALLEKYKTGGGIQVIWYREPFYYVGHMQRLDIKERGKDRFDSYHQVYQSFGRTRLNSKAIAMGPPLWENRGIVYRILGETFTFGDGKEQIIKNVQREPGMDRHRGEIALRHISNLQMDTIEALRRQLTIHKFLEECQSGDFNAASEDFLRLPWLPYHELGVGFTMLNKVEGIDFADPITWKGTGLLTLFRHESELAYKILATVKILKESFARAPKETRLHDEKTPHLAVSEDLIKDYVSNYSREMNSLCDFLDDITPKLGFGCGVLKQFGNTSKVIRQNLEKLEAVREDDWINKSEFDDIFRRLNEEP